MSRSSRGGFLWQLAPDTGAIPAARHAFESWLRQHGAVEDDVHDMAVVLSELASNAAIGAPSGTTALIQAIVDDGDLRLEVSNEVEDADADVLRWDLEDPLRGGGRGLLIVRAYTDSMEVESERGSIIVRCARRLESGS
jgi:anti-sigma regulatory factor (Ser/Thr protein kinase)